jgi:hypothetical protein
MLQPAGFAGRDKAALRSAARIPSRALNAIGVAKSTHGNSAMTAFPRSFLYCNDFALQNHFFLC